MELISQIELVESLEKYNAVALKKLFKHVAKWSAITQPEENDILSENYVDQYLFQM